MRGVEVEIRDSNGNNCDERTVGEIFVRSDSLFSGYFGDAAGTANVLRDGWLQTGDLGYLSEGQLYFCGRSKDLVIIGGRNVNPDAVELAILESTGLLPDQVAVFGIPDERKGTEAMIVVLGGTRLRDTAWDEMERLVRHAVQRSVGVVPDLVLSVRRGWIVRTASGKRDRNAMRRRFLTESGVN